MFYKYYFFEIIYCVFETNLKRTKFYNDGNRTFWAALTPSYKRHLTPSGSHSKEKRLLWLAAQIRDSMNSLNKKIILYAVSAVALTATIGFIIQTDALAGLKEDFNLLFKENERHKQQVGKQAVTIQQLGEEIKLRDDSISTLNLKITSLIEETTSLKNKIRSLDKKVQQRSEKVAVLTKKINTLEKNNSVDKKKMATLAKERDDLLKQMESMSRQRMDNSQQLEANKDKVTQNNTMLKQLKKERNEQKEKMKMLDGSAKPTPSKEPVHTASTAPAFVPNELSIAKQKDEIIQSRKMARMRDIVLSTTVNYKSVQLKNNKKGKELEEIKNGGWRYTVIELDLSNPDAEAIFDEDFIIQVFDLDDHKVVPVNESNPNFPDSEMGAAGYRFTYEGKPIEIQYFNSQKKTGKNYEIRLFYAAKGFLLPISNGKKWIVAGWCSGGTIISPPI